MTSTERPTMTLEQAKREYVNRYTCDHVPNWATKPAPNGKYYAPQYKSDEEWFALTVFPPHTPDWCRKTDCYSSNQTWPLGNWLDKPYRTGNR